MMRRRGFTLVEITIALGLMLIVTGAVYRLLTVTQRFSRVQAAQLSLQSNVRTGALVAASELRGLSTVTGGTPAQNDILSLTGNGLTYRAVRGTGFLCQAPTSAQIRISRSGFSGYRDPQPARDSFYLFLEGNPDTGEDDSWLPLPITSVATGSTCAGGGEPALALGVPPTTWPPDVGAGTPVRIYEVMELRAYQSGGQWWLGARSVSSGEAIQPLAGPLAGSDGFHLEYLNQSGAATGDPTAVAGIRITMRGSGEALPPAGGSAMEEELITQVAVRNSIHH